MKLLYFPGSPGTPIETQELAKYLEPQHQVLSLINPSEPKALIAYSWGTIPALKFAQNPTNNVKAIILISPFIVPKKSILAYMTKMPILGDFLLNVFKKQAIEKFIQKTSSPEIPSNFYRSLSPQLSENNVLKQSLIEKANINNMEIEKLIRMNTLKTLLIFAFEDKISNYEKNSKRLVSDHTTVIKLPNYGHALHILHPQEISQYIKEYLDKI